VAERPRGRLQSDYTPVQIRTLAFGRASEGWLAVEKIYDLRPGYRLDKRLAEEKTYDLQPKNCNSGHSNGETPGPIPNPEVKPVHVTCGTEVREPSGNTTRCYYYSHYYTS
jgi:hypothetical protein